LACVSKVKDGESMIDVLLTSEPYRTGIAKLLPIILGFVFSFMTNVNAEETSEPVNDLQASGEEVETKKVNAEQDRLQQAIVRSDRLRRELSRLIASTRSEQTHRRLSPSQLAAAAQRIRRLGYNLQKSQAKVSSLELERARAVNRVVPGAVSQEEMCRLDSQNEIDNLLLEQQRLEAETECPRARSRLAEIKVALAKLKLDIAKADLHDASRFPPNTISESEYRRLQSEVSAAKQRLDDAKSLGKCSWLRGIGYFPSYLKGILSCRARTS